MDIRGGGSSGGVCPWTPPPHSVYVDTTDGDKQYTVTAENHALPDMKITKRDAMSGKPIAGTVFSIKSVTGNYSTSVTTGVDGSATLIYPR